MLHLLVAQIRYLQHVHTLLATLNDTATAPTVGPGIYVLYLVSYLIGGLAYYGIFKKAGEDGWKGFVPIWNIVILLQITGKPIWWIVMFFIPFANIVFGIMMLNALSVSFGHGAGFTVGLIFLSIIFLFILGFSSNTYRGPNGIGAAPVGYAAA